MPSSYSCVPTVSITYVASNDPTWQQRSGGSPTRCRRGSRPERVADTGRVGLAVLVGAVDVDGRLAAALDHRALGPEGSHPHVDPVEDLGRRPAGLLLGQRGLVLVGEQVGRAVDEPTDLLAVHPGELLGRVRGEREAAEAALLGVPDHRLGVVGADDDEVEPTDPVGDGLQLDLLASLMAPG